MEDRVAVILEGEKGGGGGFLLHLLDIFNCQNSQEILFTSFAIEAVTGFNWWVTRTNRFFFCSQVIHRYFFLSVLVFSSNSIYLTPNIIL